MKRKIVAVHLLNNYTGSPLILSHALTAFRKFGWEVDLHTSKGPGFLDQVEVDNRVHAWYVWHPNKYRRLLHFFMSQIMVFFSLLRYWRQPVSIYANTILPFGAGLAGWVMGKKVIYHIHETEFQPPAFTKFLLWVIQKTAGKLIFVSRYLQDYHHFPDIEQTVIYNALSPDFVEKAAKMRKNKDSGGDFEILMICSLKKAKGIFEFIELAQKLPQLSFTLVISSTEDHIKSFLGKTHLPANLSLMPLQKDVHPFYAKADILLSLSHPDEWPETFGMTIVEGLAYGLPAIVPAIGAPLEIIQEGKQGFHLNVDQLDSIADRIWELYKGESERMRMAEAAKIRAGDFSMERFGEEILKSLD